MYYVFCFIRKIFDNTIIIHIYCIIHNIRVHTYIDQTNFITISLNVTNSHNFIHKFHHFNNKIIYKILMKKIKFIIR